jgi:hypothetical protein
MDKMECVKATLHKVMRHGGAIADAGFQYREMVRTGKFTDVGFNGKELLHVNGAEFQRRVEAEFTHPDYNHTKAKILAWTNRVCNQYNTHIRSSLGLPEHLCTDDAILVTNKTITGSKTIFANNSDHVKITKVGEDVIQFDVPGKMVELNNAVVAFLPNNQAMVMDRINLCRENKEFAVKKMIEDNWLDLRPVFSSTVHKAQGATHNRVYVNLTDIGNCPIPSDVARMLYVAITRASEQVIIYGQLPPGYRGLM